ncbi:MAG: hypothetical protein GXP61_08495 [Epsilonproteobacteria bacterium]|nr:hypothetical protein [Campylobacterota bacterium]
MKIIYVLFFVTLSLFGSSCADQYSNENYATASDNFSDIVGNSFEKYFNKDINNFKEFKKADIQGEIYYIKKDSFIKKGDNYYPIKDGVWKLHADKHNRIDELDLAHDTLYQDPAEEIANDLNDDMDNLWAKWAGDAYGYYMVPEYVQINYNSFYISLKTFIYGSEGDSTGLKKAFVDFYIINNTKEVNNYIQCRKR